MIKLSRESSSGEYVQSGSYWTCNDRSPLGKCNHIVMSFFCTMTSLHQGFWKISRGKPFSFLKFFLKQNFDLPNYIGTLSFLVQNCTFIYCWVNEILFSLLRCFSVVPLSWSFLCRLVPFPSIIYCMGFKLLSLVLQFSANWNWDLGHGRQVFITILYNPSPKSKL